MKRLQGIAAAPGVALEPLSLVRGSPASDHATEPVDLDGAVSEAARQLEQLAARLRAGGRSDEAAIFEAQILMAHDEALLDEARHLIASGEPSDRAISLAGERAAAPLEALSDELLAARGTDVRDVAERIARAVRGERQPSLEQRSIIVAQDIAPSMAAELDSELLAGIALEGGSPSAHACILARALGIPAVVAIPGLMRAVAGASRMSIDGVSGEVVLDPDDVSEAASRERMVDLRHQREADDRLRQHPLATADGHRIIMAANVSRPDEAERARSAGAEAVGLFRTEFAFLDRARAPSEDEQTRAYARVLRTFGGAEVVLRLLDVGGDKPLPYLPQPAEANPFLGVRGIRIGAEQPDVLLVQLRAFIRAAADAQVDAPALMLPMVADLADLHQGRRLLDTAMTQTAARGVAGVQPRLGVMIEVPAAVLVADQLATEAAFFSIGTNDLTQYLLAADRGNAALAARQDPLHPAVLRAISQVVTAAEDHRIPVGVCGEMAGDAIGAVVLIGLGIRELSMDPASFGVIKRAVGGLTRDEMRAVAAECLQLADAVAVRNLVTSRSPTS